MAYECPNCGKPTRPHARFCGFCGYRLQAAESDAAKKSEFSQLGQTKPNQKAAPGATPNSISCPYCGKINRPGVKFCAGCGKQLTPGRTPQVSPPPVSLDEKTTRVKGSRIVRFVVFLGVFVIICVSLFFIAYSFGYLDLDTIFPSWTATAVVVGETEPTNTPVQFTQTPSPSQEPTNTSTPTSTLSPTETLPPTATSTPTPKILFEDQYNQDLRNWQSWENPSEDMDTDILPPQIILNEYLDLKGMDYDKVGVTSVQTITLVSGLVIEFEAEVDNPVNASLYFDWSPGNDPRPPDQLGPIYLEVKDTEVVFHYIYDGNDMECPVPFQDSLLRTYRILFGSDWEVVLSVGDENLEEVCRSFIDQPGQLFGRITFSGFGLIDRITINQMTP